MCRFTLYMGPPVRLATLLTEPSHSLILQSFESSERTEPLNGDGFGVGWYAPRLTAEPAVFRDVTPAWNNRSLHSVARVVASPCILAHVRAASPGSDVNLANCHPFVHGRHLFMHNGCIGSFQSVRRRMLEGLGDESFDLVRGSTDTEHLFAVFMDEFARLGAPEVADEADDLAGARALGVALARSLATVTALVHEFGGGVPSYLNVAVSDGSGAAVSRFTDHPSGPPESLYLRLDPLYEPVGRRFSAKRPEDEGRSVIVSSERLTDDERWTIVPPQSLVMFDRWSEPLIVPLEADGSWSGGSRGG